MIFNLSKVNFEHVIVIMSSRMNIEYHRHIHFIWSDEEISFSVEISPSILKTLASFFFQKELQA